MEWELEMGTHTHTHTYYYSPLGKNILSTETEAFPFVFPLIRVVRVVASALKFSPAPISMLPETVPRRALITGRR